LDGGYELLVSTGAQRATQTLACFLAALGERVPGGVVVEPGLRSKREERWREAYRKAGSGALDAMRTADPELVEEDSAALGAALGRGTASSRPCSGAPKSAPARAGSRHEQPVAPTSKTCSRDSPNVCPPQATRALGQQSDRQRPPCVLTVLVDSHRDEIEVRRRRDERPDASHATR
jgi:hypothetical protein